MKKKSIAISFILLFFTGVFFYFGKNINGIILDKNYKQEIINASGKAYTLEDMRVVAGPNELKYFITKNDANPSVYTPSPENIKKEKFKANFHIHTDNSDGSLSVEKLLNQAEDYAKTHPDKPFYLAITDHNTVNGLKKALDILQKNPKKYNNIRLVLGMEVFSTLEAQKDVMKKPVDIHVLCWAINPYDEELNKIFFKKNLKDKGNYSYRTFDDAINLLKTKGITGIAHPIRYVTEDNMVKDKFHYYDYLINKYKSLNNGHVLFAEAYYQSYTTDEEKSLVGKINAKFKENNIIRTGSTDTHGMSIFQR